MFFALQTFQGRKCTETKSEQSPWWTVDLLSVQVTKPPNPSDNDDDTGDQTTYPLLIMMVIPPSPSDNDDDHPQDNLPFSHEIHSV